MNVTSVEPTTTRALLIAPARLAGMVDDLLAHAAHRPTIVACLQPGGWADADVNWVQRVVEEVRAEVVLFSLPAALVPALRPVMQSLTDLNIPWRFLPTPEDLLAGVAAPVPHPQPSGAMVRGCLSTQAGVIDTVNLIGRTPQPLHEDAIRGTITDHTVMITGAGGSIGSELARIVARFQPRRILLVERSENALFEIDRQIARLHPDLPRQAVLHDIAQPGRTNALLARLKPQVIFHAAAHKHVPMMEDHPAEAVENNYFGTRSVADAAHQHGVLRFVMISSDKAVNPSSVMGATKRLAERYIQWLNRRSKTVYCMVRFGNVLGSACSVLPIWSGQLAQGLPLTVTDPQMSRYFMTIPEAAGLVIQAAGYARGGEVFLLDMGQPVRILDLARRFLRQHGLEPGVDVPIQITGIRPGEKLYEELAYEGEDMLATPHQSIRIWRSDPPSDALMQRIMQTFDRLRDGDGRQDHAWQHTSAEAVLAALHMAVPEMLTAPRRAAG